MPAPSGMPPLPTQVTTREVFVIAVVDIGDSGESRGKSLKIIEADPFDSITVDPADAAVYHLGNNGTARELLKRWPVTN